MSVAISQVATRNSHDPSPTRAGVMAIAEPMTTPRKSTFTRSAGIPSRPGLVSRRRPPGPSAESVSGASRRSAMSVPLQGPSGGGAAAGPHEDSGGSPGGRRRPPAGVLPHAQPASAIALLIVSPADVIVDTGSFPLTIAEYALPSGSHTEAIAGMAGIGAAALAASVNTVRSGSSTCSWTDV